MLQILPAPTLFIISPRPQGLTLRTATQFCKPDRVTNLKPGFMAHVDGAQAQLTNALFWIAEFQSFRINMMKAEKN